MVDIRRELHLAAESQRHRQGRARLPKNTPSRPNRPSPLGQDSSSPDELAFPITTAELPDPTLETMDSLFVILIFGAFAALLIGSAISGYKRRQARRLALSELAAKHGWRFDPSSDYDHDSRYKQFSIFTAGEAP